MQSETIQYPFISGTLPQIKAGTGHIDRPENDVIERMPNFQAGDEEKMITIWNEFEMLTDVIAKGVSVTAPGIIAHSRWRMEPVEEERIATISPVKQAVVPVSRVTKTAGGTILVICAFSLIGSLLTGFHIVHPYFALAFGFASGGFYLMGRHLGRRER